MVVKVVPLETSDERLVEGVQILEVPTVEQDQLDAEIEPCRAFSQQFKGGLFGSRSIMGP